MTPFRPHPQTTDQSDDLPIWGVVWCFWQNQRLRFSTQKGFICAMTRIEEPHLIRVDLMLHNLHNLENMISTQK